MRALENRIRANGEILAFGARIAAIVAILARGDGRDLDHGKRWVGDAVISGKLGHGEAGVRILILSHAAVLNDFALDHDFRIGNRLGFDGQGIDQLHGLLANAARDCQLIIAERRGWLFILGADMDGGIKSHIDGNVTSVPSSGSLPSTRPMQKKGPAS